MGPYIVGQFRSLESELSKRVGFLQLHASGVNAGVPVTYDGPLLEELEEASMQSLDFRPLEPDFIRELANLRLLNRSS